MHSIELLNPKLLTAVDKVETSKELKSDFEDMTACSLLRDPVANNEACSNKNEKLSESDSIVSPVS